MKFVIKLRVRKHMAYFLILKNIKMSKNYKIAVIPGKKEVSAAIDRSMAYFTGKKMKSQTADPMGYSTGKAGDPVIENL